MVDRKETTWCTLCGARFTHAEVDGHTCCPKCGHKGVPCDPNEDVMIAVNWHELRILGIWAENHAQQCDKSDSDLYMVKVVYAITRRLQRQFPSNTALTLSGEIMQVRDHGIGIEGYNVAKNSLIPINGPGAVIDATLASAKVVV